MTAHSAIIEWELDEVDLGGGLNDLEALRWSPLALSKGSIFDQIIESALMDDQEHYDENNYIYSLCLCRPSLTARSGDPVPLFEDGSSLHDELPVGTFDDVFRIPDLLTPIPNH